LKELGSKFASPNVALKSEMADITKFAFEYSQVDNINTSDVISKNNVYENNLYYFSMTS